MTALADPGDPDPKNPESLEALSVDALVELAERRLRRGGTASALEPFRVVLKRNPHHATALRYSAMLTADTDQADDHYRRAFALGALEAEDYLDWAQLLLTATPRRPRQAVEVVHRLRNRFPERSDALAQAAIILDEADDLASAQSVMAAIKDPRGLPELLTLRLMVVIDNLLDVDKPWHGQYRTMAASLIEMLANEEHPRTLVEAARLACVHGDYARANQYLQNIDKPQVDSVMQNATALRAVVAASYDNYDEVIRNVELLPDILNGWLRLMYAAALHDVGRFDAARRELELLDGENERELRVRGLLSRITVLYDQADFAGHWKAIQASARTDATGLPPTVQATIVNCRMVLDHTRSDAGVRKIDRLLETPGLDEIDVGVLRLTRAEIILRMARHMTSRQCDAELSARETLSRLRKQLSTDVSNLAQVAYLALLVDDDDVALSLLDGLDRSGDRWRERTLRAIVLLRKARPMEAVALLDELLKQRRHDLDRRCLHVQAELAAGRVDDAARDAAALVRFAPGHVTGRLLHAEALFTAAGEPAKDKPDDYPHLIQATREYAMVLRLHKNLTELLAGRKPAGEVGSELLPKTTLVHVARQCVISAIRVTWASSKAELPFDRSIHRCAKIALKTLAAEDKHEAKRFKRLLDRPRNRRYRRYIGRLGALVLSATLAVAAWRLGPVITDFSALSAPRIVLFVAAAVVFLWPYIQKLNIGPFGLERTQADLTLPSSGDLLPGSAAAIPRLFGRLLTPPTPTWMPKGYDEAPIPVWNTTPLQEVNQKGTEGKTAALDGTNQKPPQHHRER